ncbi:MAG TPA: potassium-transporting ATPase subunit KdpC [Gaiellales bacterium]|nr:potassium-transporting ATPase subunit KdpC [Gaiellales bacterium]
MRTNIIRSAIVIVASTLLLGFVYPAVMVAVGQIAFSHQANGSLIRRDGKTVGSTLAAQAFNGPRYFHPRPSAVAYDAAGTSFSNLGPNSKALAKLVHERVGKIMKLEGPYNSGLTVKDIPVDAVTASGSGIDPDISRAYAELQASRIAAVRHLPIATVQKLIDEHVDGRSFGFLGEPGVNVLELNLALDQEH